MPLAISVVITTRNHAASLVKALESLDRQTLAKDRYEVIVADNGSTDATRDVVER